MCYTTVPTTLLGDDEQIMCAECTTLNPTYLERCQHCASDLEEGFVVYGEDIDRDLPLIPKHDAPDPQSLYEENDDYMMCCHSRLRDCTCEMAVSFTTVDGAAIDNLIDIYDDTAGCDGCALQYSVRCARYVNLLDRWIEDPDVQYDPIIPCGLFTPLEKEKR